MICVSIGNIPFNKALELCQKEKLVEIRADLMSITENQLKELLDAGADVVFTYRKISGPDSTRINFYRMAIQCGAKYVDIDYYEDYSLYKELNREIKAADCRLILSHHNYEKTPSREELKRTLNLFNNEGADISKIACMVNSDEDIITLLSLYRRPGNKLILGMGQKGIITRIAAIYMGAEFTFAAPEGEAKTAPGQMTRKNLEEIFRLIG